MLQAAATDAEASVLPMVAQLATGKRSADAFRILIATLISSRTKDEVTAVATDRLFQLAPSAATMAALHLGRLERAIFPAGFYRTKARHIRAAARMLQAEYAGQVPSSREQLMQLPGVGRKTANLVLGSAFRIPAICVDTHVHRVSNRVGWVATTRPLATEQGLMQAARRALWIQINPAVVAFGQRVCKPITPQCPRCPFSRDCAKVGVA